MHGIDLTAQLLDGANGLLCSGSTHFLPCFRGVFAEHKKYSHNNPPFMLAIDGLLNTA
jgi:hypothetical protein